MKLKNKLKNWLLIALALLATSNGLAAVITSVLPTTASAAPTCGTSSTSACGIPVVANQYDSNGVVANYSSVLCTPVIHKAAAVNTSPSGNGPVYEFGKGTGSLDQQLPSGFPTSGDPYTTIEAANSGQHLISISFEGLNSRNNTLCEHALGFVQSASSNKSSFYGAWNDGGPFSSNTMYYAHATVDASNKVLKFSLPKAFYNQQMAKSYTVSMGSSANDPENVFADPNAFPSTGGGGSTSAGNCFETQSGNSADLKKCIDSTPHAIFSDASTILYAGEVYTNLKWSGAGIYDLTKPIDSSRLKNGVPKLTLDTTNSCTDINMDEKGNGSDLNDINRSLNSCTGSISLTMTNYDLSTNKVEGTVTAERTNFNVLAAYYPKDDTVHLVYASAGGNEDPYFGNYARVATCPAGSGVTGPCYVLSDGGLSGCNTSKPLFSFASDPHGLSSLNDGVVTANWRLPSNDNCNYTNIKVGVFIQPVDAVPPVAPSSQTHTTGSSPEINCSVTIFNPLSWFLCPLATALESLVGQLDNAINSYLQIDNTSSGNLFQSNCGSTGGKTCGYYQAWQVVRNISLGLIAVAALVAIVSQAAGFEILDAYTIRKVLPRLLITSIGIALAWPLLMWLITLTNDLGIGVRQLIYAPFSAYKVELGGGSQFVLGFFGAGLAIVALGFAGLLSFVATGALAAAVAFLVLTLRQMLIVMLVIFSPIAIACYVLPNTQKVWKVWWESLFKGLLMFPIISAFIAIGRVFAAVNSHNTGAIAQLLAFTAYFAPYFLIPFAFRLAGGAIGTISGMVNDRSKGGFDRLKKFRGGQVTKNMSDLKAGSRYNPNSAFTKALGGNAINRVGSNVGAGVRGRFGFGGTGASVRANNSNLTMDAAARESHAFAAQMNNEGVMAALAFGNDERKLRQLKHYQKEDGSGVDEAKLKADMDGARGIGVDRRMQVAASEALAKSGKVLGNREEAESLYETVGGGNEALKNAVKGNYQFTSRQVGRADIGRNSDQESLRELNVSDLSRQKPKSLENLFGAGSGPGSTMANPAQTPIIRAMSESVAKGNVVEANHYADILYAAQSSPYTSPEQQEHIQKAIDYANGMTGPDGQPALIMAGAARRAQAKLGRGDVDGTTGAPRGAGPPA